MKKMMIKILATSTCILSLLGFASACKNNSASNFDKGETYDFVFDRPFYSTPDEFMKIDGVLNEDIWENKTWLESTMKGVTLKATTAFTSAGVYVGLYAEDSSISWVARNNFQTSGTEKTNSFFTVQIVKAGDSNSTSQSSYTSMDDYTFYIDCQNACSFRERQYCANSVLDGEINSGETKSLTAELFLPWSEMDYSQKELNENGTPDNIQMDVRWMHVAENSNSTNFTVKSSALQLYTNLSYPFYDENGMITKYESGQFGNAIDGAPATTEWEFAKNADGKIEKATSLVDRAQILFFREDKNGIKTSKANSFSIKARVKPIAPLGSGSNPLTGFWISGNGYVVTGIYGTELVNNKAVQFRNSKSISDVQWLGESQDFTLRDTVLTEYDKDYVDLEIIKNGNNFYYFYNDIFFKQEERLNWDIQAEVGLFTNGKAEFTNMEFESYDGREDELIEKLSEYVYFVTVPEAKAGGYISADKVAVKKGESVTVNVSTNNRYYLSDLTLNGVSCYEDVKANIQEGKYTFIPTADTKVDCAYQRFDASELYDVSFTLYGGTEDGANNTPMPDARYVIKSGNNVLYYESNANNRGIINIKLSKAGTAFNGQTLDGRYTLVIESQGYRYFEKEFTIAADQSAEIKETLILQPVTMGAVTLNGSNTERVNMTNVAYDEATEKYYVESGNALAYYKGMTTNSTKGYDYIVEATLTVTAPAGMDTMNDQLGGVTGIAIASGGYERIILKYTHYSWEKNNLCLEVEGSEISIKGFAHGLASSGTNGTSTGGTLTFKIARYQDVIYVFDSEGNIGIWLDSKGVHLGEGKSFKSTSKLDAINAKVKLFFNKGQENAIGLANYNNIATVWNVAMNRNSADVQALLSGGDMTFALETADYVAETSGLTVGDGFAKGTPVTVTMTSKRASEIAGRLTVTYDGGSLEISGAYDMDAKTSVFTFNYPGECTVTVSEWISYDTIEGTLTGADEGYRVDAYDKATGAYITTYENKVNADGAYSFNSLATVYNFVITDGEKVAFIEDGDATGALQSAKYMVTNGDYALIKESLDGQYVYTTKNKEMNLLLNPTLTTGEFDVKAGLTATATRGGQGNAGLRIYNGAAYIEFNYGTMCDNGNGGTLGVSDGQTALGVNYVTMDATKSIHVDNRIFTGQFNSTAMATRFRVVRKNGELKIYAGGKSEDYYELFTINSTGIHFYNEDLTLCTATLSGSTWKYEAMADINMSSLVGYNSLLAQFVTADSLQLGLFSKQDTAEYPFTVKVEELQWTTLSGTIAGVQSGVEYTADVYEADGTYVNTYKNCVTTGGALRVDVATAEQGKAYKLIVYGGGKAVFLENVVSGTAADGTLADAKYLLASGTYAERKDAATDGKFVATQTSGGSNPSEYVKLKLADTIGANETLQIDYVRKSGTAGVVRVAGFTLYGANGAYVHVYFSSNSNLLDNFIVLCDGENTQTYKERDRGGNTDSAKGYRIADFGQGGMYAHYRVVMTEGSLKVQYKMEKSEHVASGMSANTWIDFFTLSSTTLSHRTSEHWQAESGSVNFETLWSAISGGMTFETELMANVANYTWDVTLALTE